MTPIVIAGIDTEVGKTLVSAIVTRALNATYWKPIQCGTPSDSQWMRRYTEKIHPEVYRFRSPVSPHLASRREEIAIELNPLLLPPKVPGPLVIEGTGGLLAPLNETLCWGDVAMHWKARWILVHRHYLGSLNHFCLTIEGMRKRGIDLAAIVINGDCRDDATDEMLVQKAKTPLLGKLTWQKPLTDPYIQSMATAWKPRLLQILGA